MARCRGVEEPGAVVQRTRVWLQLRLRLPTDQCTAGLATAGTGKDSFTSPLQKIIFSIIHFL